MLRYRNGRVYKDHSGLITFVLAVVIAVMIFVGYSYGSTYELKYFSASWCHFCEQLNKEVLSDPEVKTAMKDITIVKLDIDSPEARKYGVRTVPYLIFEKDGQVIGRIIGYNNKQVFLKTLKDILK